jgi:Na+/melibiose symporter-like transporter
MSSPSSQEDWMNGWVRVAGGVVLLVVGVVWILQGSGATGGSGGMNGQSQWLVIGLVVAVVGLILVVAGVRKVRSRASR